MRLAILLSGSLLTAMGLLAQDADPGRVLFENRCARCHGADGRGGELGPAIGTRLRARTDAQLAALVREGLPDRGMPPSQLKDAEMAQLTRFLRTLQPRGAGPPPVRLQVRTVDGRQLDGLVLGQGFEDLQLRTGDERVHLLRRAGDRYREVTSETNWPTYNGDPGGNRYTALTQIDRNNVTRLGATWIFTLPNTGRLEVTPVVVDGVMYVSSANECYALDAGSGRQIWHYQRQRTRNLVGNAAGGINRGVAVAGERVFMVTDNDHIIALNRATGKLLWETGMADWSQNYNATSAPLVVGSLVISGTS